MKYILQRSMASSYLDVMKLREFVPCEARCRLTNYVCNIREIVFDPLRIEETNEQFRQQGYIVSEGLNVIGVTEDDGALMWGGFNSIYCLKKGEKVVGLLEHIAFEDVSHLTRLFSIKNKKAEIDQLIMQLTEKYTPKEG